MKKGSKNRKPETSRAEDWICQAEAARIRGVSRQAIGDLIKRGRLHVRRIGGEPLLNRIEVGRFVPQPGRPRRLAYLTMHLRHNPFRAPAKKGDSFQHKAATREA